LDIKTKDETIAEKSSKLADQLEKNKRMEEDSGKLKNRTVELEKENARALQEI